MTHPAAPRVLIVDDEPDICLNLSDILTDVGFRVDCAFDGLAALELVREVPYEVALIDLKMPGMDGLTLYREIKKLRAGTVAIVVTAYASESTTRAALKAGAWHLLPKPIDVPRLLELLAQANEQPLVLIVDDDREFCENLWQILREGGYRVGLAHEVGSVALQVRDSGIWAALIDMRLPGGDGLDVFRQIREAVPSAKTIMITGHSEMLELVDLTLDEGAYAAVLKPLDVSALLTLLNRLAQPTG